jgi:hypothetical protein
MTNPTRDPIEAAINALIAETGTVCPSGAIGQYIEADSIEDLRDGLIAAIAAYLEAQASPIGEAIAGALFDFGGQLTTNDAAIVAGACHDASPMAAEIEKFLAKRGLSNVNADVMGWTDILGAPKPPKESK